MANGLIRWQKRRPWKRFHNTARAGGPDRNYVPSIHAATRAKIDVNPCRLRSGAERTTARGGNRSARANPCDCWRRLGKNTHPYLSRSLLARKRDRSAQHFASHIHEQSCAGNASPRREFVAGRCERTLGRNISFGRKPDFAQARQRARLLERIHHYGPRRSKGFDL